MTDLMMMNKTPITMNENVNKYFSPPLIAIPPMPDAQIATPKEHNILNIVPAKHAGN